MFYIISKFLGFFAQPLVASVLAVAVGLILQRRHVRYGRAVALTGLCLLASMSIGPLGDILIYPLEQRFAFVPRPGPDAHVTGIIILGGMEEGHVSLGRGALALNECAERLTEAVLLAHRYPDARVMFTGGSFEPDGQVVADMVGDYLRSARVASERIVVEREARTTFENARFLKAMVPPKAGEQFLLLTSAFHMPRSMGVFRRAGYDVIPYQVDYRTAGVGDLIRPHFYPADGLKTADIAIKEWIGLLAYRLSGRTDALWPGP
jgi:uncharacterized SAM-binding protein YcdF (DUF218 family)